MLQARLVDKERIVVEDVEMPEVGEREVLINVKVCGVCGSDIHFYEDRHPFIHPRMVLGHEFSGVVHKIGDKVNEVGVGDKVTVEPIIACGNCYNCLRNRHNICLNLKFIGAFGYDGGFTEYVKVPADIVIKVPTSMSFEDAALIEPLAVGVHAVRRSELKIGNKAIVFGAGTIGLLTMQAIKSAGSSHIIVVDPIESRLKVALNMGADEAIKPDELDKIVENKLGSERADIIFDCVGIEDTINKAIVIARPGSKIVLIGCSPEEKVGTKLIYIQNNEIDLLGSVTYAREDFLAAISLVSTNKAQVNKIVTHRVSLNEIDKAFKIMLNREDNAIKVLVVNEKID